MPSSVTTLATWTHPPIIKQNRCHQLRWRWQRRRVSISSSHISRGGLRTFVFVVIWKKFVLIDSKYSLSHSGPSTNKWAWVPYFYFVTRTRGIKTERGRRRQIRARARNRGSIISLIAFRGFLRISKIKKGKRVQAEGQTNNKTTENRKSSPPGSNQLCKFGFSVH